MIKALVIFGLCLLTLYAPMELSRVIVAYGLAPDTTFELCFIWGCYLSAAGILIKVVKC